MSNTPSWKLIDLLKTTSLFFQKKEIENPRLNAELLLAHILDMDRVSLYVNFERTLLPDEIGRYRSAVSRRIKGEPLQYILGQTEFMGFPFFVTKDVLIPRPETEILCEEVLKLRESETELHFLDIGTGSGCIPISLVRIWSGASALSIDISHQALKIAEQNKQLNGIDGQLDITFYQKDLFDEWPDSRFNINFTAVISNPPYIAQDEMSGLQKEVKDHEPQIALTDGADGLRFYKQIFKLAFEKKIKTKYLFLEMSGSQPEHIRKQAEKFNFKEISSIRDLNKIPRVLRILV